MPTRNRLNNLPLDEFLTGSLSLYYMKQDLGVETFGGDKVFYVHKRNDYFVASGDMQILRCFHNTNNLGNEGRTYYVHGVFGYHY